MIRSINHSDMLPYCGICHSVNSSRELLESKQSASGSLLEGHLMVSKTIVDGAQLVESLGVVIL